MNSLPRFLLPVLNRFSGSGQSRADTFEDGETVCFPGDSITHGRSYHGMIYAYYLTRFPDRKIRFLNAGICGDSPRGRAGKRTWARSRAGLAA